MNKLVKKYVDLLLKCLSKIEIEYLVRRIYEIGYNDGLKVGLYSLKGEKIGKSGFIPHNQKMKGGKKNK